MVHRRRLLGGGFLVLLAIVVLTPVSLAFETKGGRWLGADNRYIDHVDYQVDDALDASLGEMVPRWK